MQVAVFRARPRADIDADEYERTFNEMFTFASQIPGFVSIEGFANDDGEELALVLFETDEAMREWYDHPAHRQVQERARTEFYAGYDIIVASIERRHTWRAEP
jgi:heme-degrading monooxygenase HmoA